VHERYRCRSKLSRWVRNVRGSRIYGYKSETMAAEHRPGVYSRMLLIAYFEGSDSGPGIASRCQDARA